MQLENKKIILTGGTKGMDVLGGLDVLAHVAGVEANSAAVDYTDEKIKFLFDINVNGTIYTNQAAYKIFRETGVEGVIINYCSDTALSGMPNGAAYAASKGAVVGWTRSIAMEWGIESNVRCNCVNPTIKTPMYEEWLRTVDPEVKKLHLEGLKRRYPIDGSMGDAAGISRNSFYRNCERKEDLVAYKIYITIHSHLSQVDMTCTDSMFLYRNFFEYWDSNRDFLRLLHKQNLFPVFYDYFTTYCMKRLSYTFLNDFLEGEQNKAQLKHIHISFVIGGLCNVLEYWVTNQFQTSIDDLVRTLVTLSPSE